MSFIGVRYFGLDAAVTGGLLYGTGEALTTLISYALSSGGAGGSGLEIIIPIIANGILGMLAISIFPIHWLLQYRPDQPMFALGMMIPWILCGFVTAILFAKNTKEGFWMIFAIGIGMTVVGVGFYMLIVSVVGANVPGAGAIVGVIDGLFNGLTDLDPIPAIAFACLEGAFIGGVFGAFAGALKYKPGEQEEGTVKSAKPGKAKKQKQDKDYPAFGAPAGSLTTMSTTSMPNKCPYCGFNLTGKTAFCTNCGNKL